MDFLLYTESMNGSEWGYNFNQFLGFFMDFHASTESTESDLSVAVDGIHRHWHIMFDTEILSD